MKIATITLNTAYDLIGRIDHIERGEVNIVETLGLFPAGKGINVAKVLKDLGQNVAVGGFLGQDNLGDFKQMFRQQGLADRFQSVAGKTRINVKITEQNEVTDLNFSGYQIEYCDWQQFVRDSVNYCAEFDLVAVCGSLPQGVSPEMFACWLTQLSETGIKVVLDTSHQALKAGLTAKPWLVKPNQRELESWIGHSLPTLSDIIEAAKKLQNQGIQNVVVSMGSQGSLWLTENDILQAQPPQCEQVISTVGAGDSMVAGLIYGFAKGYSNTETLAFASAISAFSVSQLNIGISDIKLLNPILDQVKIRLIKNVG